MTPQKSPSRVHTWILLPLRLFLGVTFVYAGIQKLTDSQYFNPSAAGYIGKQITGFATASPLHSFLLYVAAPHALLFGALVAYGEIAIGAGTLAGLLLRPAACFGLLLNLTFFLSATWRVYPYFYGADIVFIFCWLTLLLNGPAHTGLPALDEIFARRLMQRTAPERQQAYTRLLHVVLGIEIAPAPQPEPAAQSILRDRYRSAPVKQRKSLSRVKEARRSFLLGLITGGASVAALSGFVYLLNAITHSSDSYLTQTTEVPLPTAPRAAATTGGTAAATPTTIARVSAVPVNNAVNFTIPSTGDPGILIHLASGQFVAFDALCTHAGCQVDYDPGSKLLLCPCHGAAFDPAKSGAAVEPPATQPLASVPIRVDSATGAILLANS